MNEVYRLRLDHYMDTGEERLQLDDLIVVQMMFDRSVVPIPVCLNRMMDEMKAEVLKRAEKYPWERRTDWC